MSMIYQAFITVFSKKKYKILGIISMLLFLVLYLFTLPATYTGGRIGLISLRFLTPELTIFSILFAVLFSINISFMLFSYQNFRGKTSATGGFLVSLITPFLCCTPILPIIFSFLGGFIPLLSASTGNMVQAFIAIHETELFIAAVLMMIFALYQQAKVLTGHQRCKVKR